MNGRLWSAGVGVVALAAVLLAGCAGPKMTGTANLVLSVRWPAQTTREIPAETQSMQVRVIPHEADVAPYERWVDRPVSEVEGETLTSTLELFGIPAGPATVEVAAYDLPFSELTGRAGYDPIAEGRTQVNLRAGKLVTASVYLFPEYMGTDLSFRYAVTRESDGRYIEVYQGDGTLVGSTTALDIGGDVESPAMGPRGETLAFVNGGRIYTSQVGPDYLGNPQLLTAEIPRGRAYADEPWTEYSPAWRQLTQETVGEDVIFLRKRMTYLDEVTPTLEYEAVGWSTWADAERWSAAWEADIYGEPLAIRDGGLDRNGDERYLAVLCRKGNEDVLYLASYEFPGGWTAVRVDKGPQGSLTPGSFCYAQEKFIYVKSGVARGLGQGYPVPAPLRDMVWMGDGRRALYFADPGGDGRGKLGVIRTAETGFDLMDTTGETDALIEISACPENRLSAY